MKINLSPEKLIANFNGLDIKIRLGVFGVIVLLIVGLDYFFLVRWQAGSLAKMDTQGQTLKDDTERVVNDTKRIEQIRQGVTLARAEFKAMDGKIRPITDLPYVVEEIGRIASQASLTVDQIVPSKEGQEQFLDVGGVKYYTIPVVIRTHAGYHLFGKFLNKLESSELLFLVRDIKIVATDKPNALDIMATLKLIMVDRPAEVN